jgi:hypothetical protein
MLLSRWYGYWVHKVSEKKSHSPLVDVPHDLIFHRELDELPLLVL